MGALADVLCNDWFGEKRGQKWVVRRGNQVIGRFKTKRELHAFFAALTEVIDTLEADRALLADQPHPRIPNSNLTARNYVVWIMRSRFLA